MTPDPLKQGLIVMAPTLVQFVPCLCRGNGNVPGAGKQSYKSYILLVFQETIPGVLSLSLLSLRIILRETPCSIALNGKKLLKCEICSVSLQKVYTVLYNTKISCI